MAAVLAHDVAQTVAEPFADLYGSRHHVVKCQIINYTEKNRNSGTLSYISMNKRTL